MHAEESISHKLQGKKETKEENFDARPDSLLDQTPSNAEADDNGYDNSTSGDNQQATDNSGDTSGFGDDDSASGDSQQSTDNSGDTSGFGDDDSASGDNQQSTD